HAMAALDKVGLADWWDHTPAELSGGQQQRAAIARALANEPGIIVADEPTGNLDSSTTHEVMDLFAAQREAGKAVVMVTHERDLSSYFTRTIELTDGAITAELGDVT
ncbi:MAG: ATP-binding cassette domain-containing protein, partial [Alphaproteobacteria bacterium]|nr:ATP-binding cassette domain-containing protein [Alphaproteobacteria bacterium]